MLAYLCCTRAYQASLRGDSVTPTTNTAPHHHHHHRRLTQPCSRLLLSSPHRALPRRAEPVVLSAADSYRLTLKHKRGERRNRQIDRQKEDGNTNRVGGDGYPLSSSVIMLSISISKSLLLLLSPFKIHQRTRNKRGWRDILRLGRGAHAIKSFGYTSSVSDKGNKFGKASVGKIGRH